MSKDFDCISIGASLLDTLVKLKNAHQHNDTASPSGVDECFALGTKTDVESIIQQSGGGATNSAVTFKRQGLLATVIGKVGSDHAGDLVKNDLRQDNIPIDHIIVAKGGKTGQSVILIDPNAERTVLTDRGSAGHLTTDDLAVLDNLKSRWVYVTSLNGLAPSIEHVWQWANKNNIKIAWNPGKLDLKIDYMHLERWFKQISLLIINREEAGMIFQQNITSENAVKELKKMKVVQAIVSDGANPIWAFDHQNTVSLTPHHIKAVDSTGAGDALGSGAVAGLMHGMTFKNALEHGLANSESVVMKVGAKTGIMYK
ncbi:MAG: carbohydrate kinase family protein [Patescibacteria group bacterium]|jgi:hypothetical protein